MNNYDCLKDETQLVEENFCNAVQIVLKTLTGFEPTSTEVPLSRSRSISGVMLLQGGASLLVALSMSRDSALSLVSYVSGIPISDIKDEDLYDGITELVNMVCGSAKASLANSGCRYELTTPFSVAGESYYLVCKAQTIKISKAFTIDNDKKIILGIYSL